MKSQLCYVMIFITIFIMTFYNCFELENFEEIKEQCQIISPEPDTTIYTSTPEFKWASVKGADSYQLFINGKQITNIKNLSYTLNEEQALTSGNYTWSIRGKNEFQYYSCGKNNFTIIIPEAAKQIDPKDKACVDTNTPTFNWKDKGGIEKYKIEISTDSDFKNIIHKGESKNKSYKSSALENDLYFWRIVSTGINGKTYTSEIYTMTIDNSFIIAVLKQPENLNPNNTKIKNLPIEFSWTGETLTNPYSYSIEISEDNFKTINFSKNKIHKPNYSLTSSDYTLENKNYNWRVRINFHSCSGNWSNTLFTYYNRKCPTIDNPILDTGKLCPGDIKAILNFKSGTISSIKSAKLDDKNATININKAEINIVGWTNGIYTWKIEREIDGCTETFTKDIEINNEIKALGWIGDGSDGWKKTESSAFCGVGYKYFCYPKNIVVDNNGNIYITELDNNRVSKWNSNGEAQGWIGDGSDGWKKTDAPPGGSNLNPPTVIDRQYRKFYNPWGIDLDTNGNIYIGEGSIDRMSRWSPTGTALKWLGSGSFGWKTTIDPATGTDYRYFDYPAGVSLDSSGDFYIVEHCNHRISKWSSNGKALGWIGGGSDGWKKTNGAVSASDYQSFYYPTGIHVDNEGNIYVSEYYNHRISKWNSNGKALGWIGGGSDGWKKTNGALLGTDYQSFRWPHGLFVTNDGKIFVAEPTNDKVSIWNKDGIALGWFGSGSETLQTGDTPTAGNDFKSFDRPTDIFVDSNGFIYVADWGNSRVSKWQYKCN